MKELRQKQAYRLEKFFLACHQLALITSHLWAGACIAHLNLFLGRSMDQNQELLKAALGFGNISVDDLLLLPAFVP